MPESPPETKRFTDEELALLLETIKPMSPDFHDMVLFALLTGLRPQEVRELERTHVQDDTPGGEYLDIHRHPPQAPSPQLRSAAGRSQAGGQARRKAA